VRLLAENGRVKALECVRVSLGGKDASVDQAATGSRFKLYVGGGPGCESDRATEAFADFQTWFKNGQGFHSCDGNFETSLPGVFAAEIAYARAERPPP